MTLIIDLIDLDIVIQEHPDKLRSVTLNSVVQSVVASFVILEAIDSSIFKGLVDSLDNVQL